ncbi:MAG: hypothetical protein EP299_11690 [Acidobacteria bacterium]|nr:MAG: hypothetical protein EP299_11690 [Acidobacteriota bacterium]
MALPRLTFLVHRGKDYTLQHYFKTWGAELRERVAIKTYPGVGATGRTWSKRLSRRLKALRTGTLPPGRTPPAGSVYVFTDLEIMASRESELVRALARRLEAAPGTTLFNDPARALTRFDLLRALSAGGVNSFGVEKLDRGVSPERWPVFTRDDRSHDDGSVSELLHSSGELSRHLDDLAAGGADLGHRTLVEYVGSPGEDGLFRKYAAIRLGDAIIPCHVFFGQHWVVKHSEVFDEATAREELKYIEANPHQEVLHRAFELAGIEYGRADYGVVNGRVEIWEINTNPYLIRPEYTQQETRRAALAAFSDRFNDALRELLDR